MSSEAVCGPMDHHKPGYAEPEDDGRRNEGPPEGAGGVEPAMTAESYDNVALQLGSVPAGKAATDLGHHGYFEKAAADSTQETACGKDLSEQEYRHSTSQQIRRMLQRSGSTVWFVSIIQRTRIRLRRKTTGMYRK